MIRSLAWKELKAQKVVSILVLIAIILSTIATTALGQSIGILKLLQIKQAEGLNGNRYATFHQLNDRQNQQLFLDNRLKNVGTYINIGSSKLKNSGLTLYLREYQGDALKAYPEISQLKKGQLPKNQGEIALSEDAIKYLNLNDTLGSIITLPLSIGLKNGTIPNYEYTADFILTGILENHYIGYTTGIVEAIVGEGTAKNILPEPYFLYSTDFKTKDKKTFQSTVDDLAQKITIQEEDIQYNWILLDALGIDYDEAESTVDLANGFPFMMIACILTGIFILLAAGLVIYNILKIAITKRIHWYGTLRALGSEKSQIYALVTTQLLILCSIGIPIGVLLGMWSAKGILIAATGFLDAKLFMAESTQALNQTIHNSTTKDLLPLIVSVLITISFAMLAAFPSARYASNVSPTLAMSGQVVKVKRRNRKSRPIRNFERYYAQLNLKRNHNRTFITILSIAMSITIFIALQSFTDSLDTSQTVQDMHTGDYAITNEIAGITPHAVEEVRSHEAVEKLNTTKLKVYEVDENGNRAIDLDIPLQSWETFQIAAVDKERLLNFIPHLSEVEQNALLTGKACLVKNPIPFSFEGEEVQRTELQKGDTITIKGKTLDVVGIAEGAITINNEGYLNGVQIIVPNVLYDALVGDTNYGEIYPTLAENSDAALFETWLDNWCHENIGSHWLSYLMVDKELAESFEQIQLLCWGLILFIGLIGALNIMNTVYTNIQTRINEIGIQRAMGMSVESVYKTFLWEGIYYALIASAIGTICGSICTLLIEAEMSTSLTLASLPFIPILEAILVSIAVCLLATAIPLRMIQKMSIVEAIETIE